MKYKKLVEEILKQCLDHRMVAEAIYTTEAKVNELAKVGRKYFLCALIPSSSPSTTNTVNYGFTLVCMDVISKTEDNTLQIQSDCIGILTDLISEIKFKEELDLINDPVFNVFQENYGDFCAGAAIDLQFEVPSTGACDLPFN